VTLPVSASTRLYALLGDPVAHSRSPSIQNAAFRETGTDAVYVALRCSSDDLPHLIRSLSAAGGGGNITLPHKERAVAVLDVPSEAVRRTGACNTFWGVDGRIHGDNTDVEGFRRAIETELPGPRVGMRILLLGSGGAARAVLSALMDEGVREVVVLNRTVERARAMARRIGGERVRVLESPAEVDGQRFDWVVNTTSLGLESDDPLPVKLQRLEGLEAVVDLIYGETSTPLLSEALHMGVTAVDGGSMLIHQGAVAFERWLDIEAPLDVMFAQLRGPKAI
jgi:shikimate dehydrogenase